MKRILGIITVVAVLAFAGAAYATGGDKVQNKVNDHTCQGNADCSTTTNTITNSTTNNTAQGGNATAKGGKATATSGSVSNATGGAGGAGGAGGNATIQKGAVQNTNSNSQGQAQSLKNQNTNKQSQGQGQKQGQNNNQTISVQNDAGSTKVYASPPSMGVASLVAAPETCMGSTSASLSGGNGIIGAGIGFGKTYESANCNRRMNARYLMSMDRGDGTLHGAALLLLAQDDDVRQALEDAGVQLPKRGSGKEAGVKTGGITPTANEKHHLKDDTLPVTPRTGPGATEQVQSN